MADYFGIPNPLTVGRGGTGTQTAFTVGSVIFAGASGVYTQNNANLFWDNTNNRLGIGTASPTHTLTLASTSQGALYNTADQTTNFSRLVFRWTANVAEIISQSGGTAPGRSLRIGMDGSSASPLIFTVGGSDRWSMTNAGNLVAGTDSAASNLILVNGSDIRPTSDSTTALNIANAAGTDFVTFDTTNNRVGIGTASPALPLDLVGRAIFTASDDQRGLQLVNSSTTGSVLTLTASAAGGRDYHIYSSANTAGSGGGRFAILDNTAGAWRMVVDSSGNMGIGTTSPSATARLHVFENVNAARDIRIENPNTGTSAQAILSLVNADPTGDRTGAIGVTGTGYTSGVVWDRQDVLYMQSDINTAGGISLAARATAGIITFHTGGNTERVRITDVGNLKIAGTAIRATTEGTNHLDIFNGTAPVGTLANGISLYSAAGELNVIDAGGVVTLLSPHDEEGNWIFDSTNTQTGKRLKIDMEKMIKFLNNYFGTDFVHEFYKEVK